MERNFRTVTVKFLTICRKRKLLPLPYIYIHRHFRKISLHSLCREEEPMSIPWERDTRTDYEMFEYAISTASDRLRRYGNTVVEPWLIGQIGIQGAEDELNDKCGFGVSVTAVPAARLKGNGTGFLVRKPVKKGAEYVYLAERLS